MGTYVRGASDHGTYARSVRGPASGVLSCIVPRKSPEGTVVRRSVAHGTLCVGWFVYLCVSPCSSGDAELGYGLARPTSQVPTQQSQALPPCPPASTTFHNPVLEALATLPERARTLVARAYLAHTSIQQ
jgi:hypothetical protein